MPVHRSKPTLQRESPMVMSKKSALYSVGLANSLYIMVSCAFEDGWRLPAAFTMPAKVGLLQLVPPTENQLPCRKIAAQQKLEATSGYPRWVPTIFAIPSW